MIDYFVLFMFGVVMTACIMALIAWFAVTAKAALDEWRR